MIGCASLVQGLFSWLVLAFFEILLDLTGVLLVDCLVGRSVDRFIASLTVSLIAPLIDPLTDYLIDILGLAFRLYWPLLGIPFAWLLISWFHES